MAGSRAAAGNSVGVLYRSTNIVEYTTIVFCAMPCHSVYELFCALKCHEPYGVYIGFSGELFFLAGPPTNVRQSMQVCGVRVGMYLEVRERPFVVHVASYAGEIINQKE